MRKDRGRTTVVGTLAAVLTCAAVLVPSPGRATPPRCVAPPATGQDTPAPSWTQQWYPPDRLTGLASGRGVTVAVIDSGVDADHPSVRGRVVPGEDPLAGGDGRVDCVGHGTAVASIVVQLAPDVTILPVRVSEQEAVDGTPPGRAVSAPAFALAIRHAVDRGARVVNLSVVLYRDDPTVRDAIRYALDRDTVVVAAVGNEYERGDPVPYPAAYDGVLGVGAIRPDGLRWPGSQVGPYVDVMAPGGEVTAAAAGHGYAVYEGTSFAVPFVAATAALVREYRPGLTAHEVDERILATVDPAPDGSRSAAYGYGIVDPYRAVTDTVGNLAATTTATAAAGPLPGAGADHPRRTAARRSRDRALAIAAVGASVAALLVLAGTAIPRARRRRWRAG